jgi:hypothetical protein
MMSFASPARGIHVRAVRRTARHRRRCRGTEWRSTCARVIGLSRAATPRESSSSARNAQFKRAYARRSARARAARANAPARARATALARFEVIHESRDRFDARAIRRRRARTVDERLALKHAARFVTCLPRAFRAYGARARRRRR